MELRQLRAACAVDDHRHFGRAASSLGLTQSTLSHAVRSLEADLGVTLFERTTRSVTVTEAGRTFLAEIRAAVSALDAAAERARAAGRGEAGSLTVGLVGSALTSVLPRLMREFRSRNPQVSITVRELTTAQQVQGLLDGTVDVGFLRPPLPPPADRAIELTTVVREPLVAVLPRGHRLASASALPVRLLAGEPFVRTPRALGVGFHDRITALCGRAGFVPDTVQHATQIDSVIGLVAAGFGVSIVPQRRPVAGVAFVPLTARGATMDLAMAVVRVGHRSPQTDAFSILVRSLVDAGTTGSRRPGTRRPTDG